MQIPKFPLWICVLALGGGTTLHADDTPAQAAARAALTQQLQGGQGNPAPAPQPSAKTPTAPVAPAPAAAPAAASTAATPVALQAGDNAAQAEARAALAKTMADMGTPLNQTQTTTPEAPIVTATIPAAAVAPMVAPAAVTAPPVDTTPVDPLTGDSAAQAEARAALAQKMTDMGTPMNQTTVTAAPIITKNGKVLPQPVPMVAPPLPVSMTKEEKLKVLLSHYMADQVTPEQYHEQRAAILAAP